MADKLEARRGTPEHVEQAFVIHSVDSDRGARVAADEHVLDGSDVVPPERSRHAANLARPGGTDLPPTAPTVCHA
jgi:hypothetical protein